MLVATVVTTLARMGRATVAESRRRVAPCRLVRRVAAAVGRRPRAIVGVDWFEGIEPDELAG
jgi:hypothetical protein